MEVYSSFFVQLFCCNFFHYHVISLAHKELRQHEWFVLKGLVICELFFFFIISFRFLCSYELWMILNEKLLQTIWILILCMRLNWVGVEKRVGNVEIKQKNTVGIWNCEKGETLGVPRHFSIDSHSDKQSRICITYIGNVR